MAASASRFLLGHLIVGQCLSFSPLLAFLKRERSSAVGKGVATIHDVHDARHKGVDIPVSQKGEQLGQLYLEDKGSTPSL